ncbi:MAG: translocation/assembly module TamB domain-containing protein [Saprospiraceae bacterium]|nr:translocation/assembly module TamB domain-containing protein [Saprospiraceae bacterium]
MSENIENTQQPPNAKEPIHTFHEKRKWVVLRRISRFVGRTLGIFVLLFLLLASIIQIPTVQEWGISKATRYLSNELGTKVEIGDFRLDFFDEISIGNIYIGNKNAPSDTLANIGRLRIDVNYFDLVWQIIQLDAIKLENTKVRIRREAGQYDDNFQFILDYFDPPKPSKRPSTKKATDVRFGQIHLRDIDFSRDDKVRGQRIDVKLKAADIHTNIINLPNQIMDLTRVNLHSPYVHIQESVGNPLPPRSQKISLSDNNNISPKQEKAFQFLIGAVSAENGIFKLDNWDKSKEISRDSIIDFDHLVVNDINIAIHNFMFTKDEWTGVVDGISLKERSGFVLNKLTVGDAKVTPTETALYGLQIETPYSVAGDTFRMMYPIGYEAFYSFNNEVILDARIHTSKVMLNDIMYFSPPLKRNPFFQKNRYANSRIEARVFGKVNSLKVNDFNIGLGEGVVAMGDFSSRDLNNINETFINLDLKNLRSSMTNLRQLIPNFKPAKDFDKLGNLDFSGKFVGFFNDFTANGTLHSALGDATMDMKLRPETDTSQAFYNGNLNLDRFNIGQLTEVPDLGKVSIKTEILRGVGFTKDKMKLDLKATIDNFQYKNYDYQNLKLAGNISHKQFNGFFESHDPNVDFKFDGSINFATDTPVYKFASNIHRLDFQKLNLLKEDYALSGDFNLDFSGSKLSNIAGTIDAHNILIVKDRVTKHTIDSLVIKSVPNIENGLVDGSKKFTIQSEVLNADITGRFSLEQIPNAFVYQFAKFHPHLAEDLGMLPKNYLSDLQNGLLLTRPPQQFEFNIFVNNTKNLTHLIDNKLDTLKNIEIEGTFDDAKDEYYWKILTPETHHYGDITIVEFGSIGQSEGADIRWDLNTTAIKLKGGQDFRQLTFQNQITADSIQIGLTSFNFSTALGMDTVELNAMIMRQDSSYKISFVSSALSRLKIFGDFWDIDRDNYIVVGKDKLYINGFDMRNEDRTVTIKSEGNRGLSAYLDNFDIRFLNKQLNDSRFVFGGKYRVYAAIEDIFEMKNFGATAMLDSFVVSGENRGVLRIEALGTDLKEPIHANISLITDTSKVIADGFYYPSVTGAHQANSIDVNLGLSNFPFKTLQLLIEEGASGFKGRVDGSLHVSGPIKTIDTEGSLRLRDAEVTVDYLKIPIIVKDETVKVTNTLFDATGGKIYDKYGNVATIKGGLTHNRFENFGLNLRVSSKNFLFLNTTREDNPLYYGVGIGEGDISFSGDFRNTDIRISAKAGKGRDEKKKEVITKITFPFTSTQATSETKFFTFKNRNLSSENKDNNDNKPKVKDLRGIDLQMELEITADAETNLIFDEVAGDNIKARGTGNFRIDIDRAGNLGMNGEYRIEKGDYLFTLLRVVNKNFTIKRGGTIRWNGSPFDATLNIDAEYKDLTTAPYNFISEYVNPSDGSEAASRKPTKVGLTLKLTGDLLKPDINFNMAFPQLQGSLKSYAETKLRLLQQDPNELNKQVFGLIVVGSFLPSDIGVSQIRSGGINTVTETVSNVLSGMLNNLVKEYITGLDIQVGYNYYQYDLVESGNPLAAGTSGQQFRLRGSYTISDRLSVSGGVGVEQGGYLQALNANNSNVFVGSDFYLDYDFSEDRRLKLRVSYIRDQDLQGRRDKPAIGLRFQQEFDSFDELWESLKIKKEKPLQNKTDSIQ